MFYKAKRAAIGKIEATMRMKRSKDYRGGSVPGSYIFVEIPPKYSVSGFMGFIKGKSSTMLYKQFGEQNTITEIESFGVEDITWIQ